MGDWNLAPAAQQWVNVVLIWVGFAMLAGLLARTLVPGPPSIGPVATLVIGMLGSVVGLFGLSYFLEGKPINPISPLGLLAASGGALVLLVVYRLLGLARPESTQQSEAKSANSS